MRCSTRPHTWDCGIDLHARTMDVCLLNQAGDIVVHRPMRAGPETCLQVMAPQREDLVVAVEGLFTWSWLAELCTHEGIPVVLGHALDLKALHGGKAKPEKIDAHTIAVRLRGGMLPQAYGYAAERRASRALLRRRMSRMRQRADWLPHIHKTHRQDNGPEPGQNIADQATRVGVAARFPAAATPKSIDGDLALRGSDAHLLTERERSRVHTAQAPHAHLRSRLHAIPGVGTSLARVRLDESHDRKRCPRGQALVSSGRLVNGAQTSAGKRSGPSGRTLGNAARTGAFSAAAGLFWRANPAGQQDLARVEKTQGQGKAVTVLAHTGAPRR